MMDGGHSILCEEPLGSILGAADEPCWHGAALPCESTLPPDVLTVIQEVRSQLASLTDYVAECRSDIDALHDFVVGRAPSSEPQSTQDVALIAKAHVEDLRAILVEELADQFSANDEHRERIQASVDSMLAWTREELSRVSRECAVALDTLGDVQDRKVESISSSVVDLELRMTQQLASLGDKYSHLRAESPCCQSTTNFPSARSFDGALEEHRAHVRLLQEALERRFEERRSSAVQSTLTLHVQEPFTSPLRATGDSISSTSFP
jgi:hypothetical protein